jgi:hypothetical protein
MVRLGGGDLRAWVPRAARQRASRHRPNADVATTRSAQVCVAAMATCGSECGGPHASARRGAPAPSAPRAKFEIGSIQREASKSREALLLAAARKQAASKEILLWMTPSEAPKALQASECSELLDPMRASCWISAQH